MPTQGGMLADKLRANLRAAEIRAPKADVERLIEDGTLERMEPHMRAVHDGEADVVPDYVWDHGPAAGATRVSEPWDPPILPAPTGASGDGLPQTIGALGRLVLDGAVSPVELLERVLARIAERDREINAFQLVLADRARCAAQAAEAEIRGGGWRGPLHGVPVAVKDLFRMAGTLTTAGGKRPLWPRDAASAAAVERLEAAGAVVVGKTRLPEFAFWPGSRNPHYGPTANPRDTSRDAGGSSSGSAAAVADGMAWAALGSDTGGSIRIPAALCGVVGLKPTYGRVGLEGCVPLAWSLDHAGPLTRSVDDAAIVLSALAGGGARRRGGAREPSRADAAAGVRVGVLGEDGTGRPLASEPALSAWRRSLAALEEAGATHVEVDLPEMSTLRAANFIVLSVEATAYHAAGLRERYDDYGEPCRSRLLSGFAYDAVDFVQAQRYRRAVRERWEALFERFDLLSTPSQPDVAPPLGEIASVKFTSPFNALGWPAVSVPFGTGVEGLPLATQLVGAPWSEARVLEVASVLER